jgi:hypothetical protein
MSTTRRNAGLYGLLLIVSILYVLDFIFAPCHKVTIVNNYPRPLDDVVLTDPLKNDYLLGYIHPEKVVEKHYNFLGEGAVTYRIDAAGVSRTGTLLEYITNGQCPAVKLTIGKDGSITAQPL